MLDYSAFSMPRIGRTVRSLLILNLVVYVIQALFGLRGGAFFDWFALSRSGIFRMRIWQFVTYTVLHGSAGHLLMNMLGLYFFGRELESALGQRAFQRLYVLCGMVAGLGWLIIGGGQARWCIGASGSIFGIIGMYAALYPQRQVTLLLFLVVPVTLSARALALGFMAVSFVMLLDGSPGGVAHAAHLFGGLTGYWLGGGRPGGGQIVDAFKARRRRSRWRVFEGEAWDPDEPSIEAVDALLDKIRTAGIGALTTRERELLERASAARRRS